MYYGALCTIISSLIWSVDANSNGVLLVNLSFVPVDAPLYTNIGTIFALPDSAA
jgi:hypothetical protein